MSKSTCQCGHVNKNWTTPRNTKEEKVTKAKITTATLNPLSWILVGCTLDKPNNVLICSGLTALLNKMLKSCNPSSFQCSSPGATAICCQATVMLAGVNCVKLQWSVIRYVYLSQPCWYHPGKVWKPLFEPEKYFIPLIFCDQGIPGIRFIHEFQ